MIAEIKTANIFKSEFISNKHFCQGTYNHRELITKQSKAYPYIPFEPTKFILEYYNIAEKVANLEG